MFGLEKTMREETTENVEKCLFKNILTIHFLYQNDAHQFAKNSSKSLSPFSPAFKHITEALANFPTAFVLEIDAVHSEQEKKNKIKEV
jgi:hypothetical protein